MRASIVLLVCLVGLNSAFSGCYRAVEKENPEPVSGKDYEFSAVDLPGEERFELTLVSMSKRELCIGNSSWPTEAGFLDNASINTAILLEGRRYPYKDFDMEACPLKACANPMKNGTRLESSLFYKDFGLPKSLYKSPKELSYSPRPIWCDTGHWIDQPFKQKRNER
jgi:hypothetical protein